MAESGSGQTRYAVNGQVRIAFEDLGGAGGAPLLLVMGLGVSRFWWPDDLVSEFAGRGFHVVAYDQRDAGQSTHFPDAGTGGPLAAVLRRRSPAYSAEDMTDDAVAVLDALGWDSAHLFGHSMGGQVAQRTALRHPRRVRSLTSSASLPSDVAGLSAVRYVHLGLVAKLARMRFPEGRDGDLALAVSATRALASPAYPFDEQAVRAMAARDQVSGVRDTAAQSRQAGAKWHGGKLSQLRVPTLVLHGSDDPLLRPAAARRTATAISGARLVILPGVGHYLPAAVYPQVAGEVRALAERAAAASSHTAGLLARPGLRPVQHQLELPLALPSARCRAAELVDIAVRLRAAELVDIAVGLRAAELVDIAVGLWAAELVGVTVRLWAAELIDIAVGLWAAELVSHYRDLHPRSTVSSPISASG